MARAAVRAKQAQQAQAQAATKQSRKQRGHASGGNPNQDLFFSRLRRRQKWVFLALAVVFAVSFAALGVGSGSGSGLQDMFSGLLGGGNNAVGDAKNEIKTNPAKGYKDLAKAYVTNKDLPNAIAALQSYLQINKKDSQTWSQLGLYEKQLAETYLQQYQQILTSAAIESPSSAFAPTGALSTQLGTDPIDAYYSQLNSSLSGPLYQKAATSYNSSLTDFQNAAKYARRADRANAELAVYSAAQAAANTKEELKALQAYVKLAPNAPNVKQIESFCKKLGGSCVPKHKK